MKRYLAIAGAAAGLSVAMTGLSAAPPEGPEGQPARNIPTFTKDVAPILYKNCVGCHRPGEIGPMSLLTYDDARPHAKAIRDEVGDNNMPPWHADPKHGKFANDRSLPAKDRDTLLRWVNNGAPEGDKKDLPPVPKFTEGWMLGQPDLVLTIPDYKVPAEGFVEYRIPRAGDEPVRGSVDPGHRSAPRRPRGRASRDRQCTPTTARAASLCPALRRRYGRARGANRWSR